MAESTATTTQYTQHTPTTDREPTDSIETPVIAHADAERSEIHTNAPAPLPTAQKTDSRTSASAPAGPIRTDTTTALQQALSIEGITPPVPVVPNVTRDRAQSSAIGPSTDLPQTMSSQDQSTGPLLLITLLLTNGARHPYRLDSAYLKRRNATVQDDDPYNLSVYKLKELILRDWRDEWELKPSSPSAIRLISFGKLLEDKTALKDLRFNHDSANVVHMTIKPQDFVEDEDAKGGKGSKSHRSEDGEGRSPGCRCLVM